MRHKKCIAFVYFETKAYRKRNKKGYPEDEAEERTDIDQLEEVGKMFVVVEDLFEDSRRYYRLAGFLHT